MRRLSGCCSTTTATACRGQRQMGRYGCSTRATRSTSPCPSMTCRPGWARQPSMSSTAPPPASSSIHSEHLQISAPRCRSAPCSIVLGGFKMKKCSSVSPLAQQIHRLQIETPPCAPGSYVPAETEQVMLYWMAFSRSAVSK